ncbi:MAG: hypothetical protein ACI4QT_08625, partial [Kiritimatiellia bacterium]
MFITQAGKAGRDIRADVGRALVRYLGYRNAGKTNDQILFDIAHQTNFALLNTAIEDTILTEFAQRSKANVPIQSFLIKYVNSAESVPFEKDIFGMDAQTNEELLRNAIQKTEQNYPDLFNTPSSTLQKEKDDDGALRAQGLKNAKKQKQSESGVQKDSSVANTDAKFSVSPPTGVQKDSSVTYPDAGEEIANAKFSIGATRRAEYGRILAKHRPDLDAQSTIDEIEKLDNPKKEKLALHWIIRGTIILPEDAYKIDDAIAVSEKAKEDPFRYKSPMELIEDNAKFNK